MHMRSLVSSASLREKGVREWQIEGIIFPSHCVLRVVLLSVVFMLLLCWRLRSEEATVSQPVVAWRGCVVCAIVGVHCYCYQRLTVSNSSTASCVRGFFSPHSLTRMSHARHTPGVVQQA